MKLDLFTPSAAEPRTWATFRDDAAGRRHRLVLGRQWSDAPPLVVIGMNPSFADAERSDPTVTRCVRRAERMGAGGLRMLNADTLVTPYPDVIFALPPVERCLPINDYVIQRECLGALMVIAAWGGDRRQAERTAHVRRKLADAGIPLFALGFTKHGHPRHPSRLGYDVQPVAWDCVA